MMVRVLFVIFGFLFFFACGGGNNSTQTSTNISSDSTDNHYLVSLNFSADVLTAIDDPSKPRTITFHNAIVKSDGSLDDYVVTLQPGEPIPNILNISVPSERVNSDSDNDVLLVSIAKDNSNPINLYVSSLPKFSKNNPTDIQITLESIVIGKIVDEAVRQSEEGSPRDLRDIILQVQTEVKDLPASTIKDILENKTSGSSAIDEGEGNNKSEEGQESGVSEVSTSTHDSSAGRDNDWVPDSVDNCLEISNVLQGDFDSDHIGDACDLCSEAGSEIYSITASPGDQSEFCYDPADPLKVLNGKSATIILIVNGHILTQTVTCGTARTYEQVVQTFENGSVGSKTITISTANQLLTLFSVSSYLNKGEINTFSASWSGGSSVGLGGFVAVHYTLEGKTQKQTTGSFSIASTGANQGTYYVPKCANNDNSQ